MNRLIIIGNGFDIAHGVKSKYEDFLLWYLMSKVRTLDKDTPDVDRLCTIKVKEKYENSYYVPTLPEFKGVENYIDFIKSFEDSGYHVITHSGFFQSIMEQERWVDIENIYYSYLKNSMVPGKRTLNNRPFPSIEQLNSDLDFLRNKFIEYLKAECDDFKCDLSESPYLKLFKEGLSFKLNCDPDSIKTFKTKLKGESKTLLLNFNYTNLIKKYEETNSVTGDSFGTIQIHGSIDYPESIVFGFGDEIDEAYQEIERLNKNKFFEHIKSFRYLQDGNYQKLMAFVANSPFEVVVLGHSLGLSDRTMLSQIFENDNLKRVHLYYHEDQKDFTEKTYEISRHFKSKGRMREIIVPFTESEPMQQVKMNEM